MPPKPSSPDELHILLTGIAMGESPRWHDNRLWFSDWGAQEIVTVDVNGNRETVLRTPFGLPFCIDWLPDNRLLIVSGRECSIEGCTGREYLERDHCEIDHADQGPTAFWNLAWLCSIHHERKSSGWILGPPDPETGKRRLDPPGSERAA